MTDCGAVGSIANTCLVKDPHTFFNGVELLDIQGQGTLKRLPDFVNRHQKCQISIIASEVLAMEVHSFGDVTELVAGSQ